jgi:hypothetical protein
MATGRKKERPWLGTEAHGLASGRGRSMKRTSSRLRYQGRQRSGNEAMANTDALGLVRTVRSEGVPVEKYGAYDCMDPVGGTGRTRR